MEGREKLDTIVENVLDNIERSVDRELTQNEKTFFVDLILGELVNMGDPAAKSLTQDAAGITYKVSSAMNILESKPAIKLPQLKKMK